MSETEKKNIFETSLNHKYSYMALKHHELFDKLEVRDICPPKDASTIDKTVYRWVFDPISDEMNFLPNYLFDEHKKNIANYFNGNFDDVRKCSRCAQSFYTSPNAAIFHHKKLSKKIIEKLGYTHIAVGNIDKNDGIATNVTDVGHFSFYEEEGCNLKSKFQITEAL